MVTAKDLNLKSNINLWNYSLYFLTFCLLYGIICYLYTSLELGYPFLKSVMLSLFPAIIYLMSLPVLIDHYESIQQHNQIVNKRIQQRYAEGKRRERWFEQNFRG